MPNEVLSVTTPFFQYYDLPITKAQKYANRTRKGDKTGITLAKMGQQASEVIQDYFKNVSQFNIYP